MATIIGYDPVTEEPIWDTPSTPPPPVATPDPTPVIVVPPIEWDIAVYMFSTDPIPEGEEVPDTNHQGIKFSDTEVYQLVTSARWAATSNFTKHAVVLLVVDGEDPDDAPCYNVDLSVKPIRISAAN
jgi:hypothetical protein